MQKHLMSLVLAFVALPASAQYVIDDGTSEQDGPTPGFANDTIWTNSFVVVAGANTIKQIHGAFHLTYALQTTAYLWADANNDSIPDVGGVLASGSYLSSVSGNTDPWHVYEIPDLTLPTGTSFIVGFHVRTPGAPQQFVGRIDTTLPTFSNRSWRATSSGTLNPNNIQTNNSGFLESLPSTWHGNYMIRASTVAVPEPATLVALGAATVVLAYRRRRRR